MNLYYNVTTNNLLIWSADGPGYLVVDSGYNVFVVIGEPEDYGYELIGEY